MQQTEPLCADFRTFTATDQKAYDRNQNIGENDERQGTDLIESQQHERNTQKDIAELVAREIEMLELQNIGIGLISSSEKTTEATIAATGGAAAAFCCMMYPTEAKNIAQAGVGSPMNSVA